jgi:hypothetical protein
MKKGSGQNASPTTVSPVKNAGAAGGAGAMAPGAAEEAERKALVQHLAATLSRALKLLRRNEPDYDDKIERAMANVAAAFVDADEAEPEKRAIVLEAIEKAGLLTVEGIGVAVGVALETENTAALAAAAKLSPKGLVELRVEQRGMVWGVAQLAAVVDCRVAEERESPDPERPGKMLRAALDLGADLWERDNDGGDALDQAIAYNDAALARWILGQAPDARALVCEKALPGRWSRPQLAILEGAEDTLRLLLDAGASCEAPDEEEPCDTLLMWAAQAGQLGCAKILIEFGAQINHRTPTGETALMRAAEHGELEVAQELIWRGANANFQSDLKETALSFAVGVCDERLVGLLAPATAAALRDANGRTAVAKAIEAQFWTVANALGAQADESEAIAGLAAFARERMPALAMLAERSLRRAAAESGGARREAATAETAQLASYAQKEENEAAAERRREIRTRAARRV